MIKGNSSSSRAFFLELVLNLVIFAFCAAVCLQVFAQAKLASDRSAALSHLSIEAQTVAENFKAANGDLAKLADALGATEVDGQALWLYYDADFERVTNPDDAAHTLLCSIEGSTRVKVAHIEIYSSIDTDPDTHDQGALFSLEVKKYVPQGGGA
jgi:Tfp pilus assembly protein PilE